MDQKNYLEKKQRHKKDGKYRRKGKNMTEESWERMGQALFAEKRAEIFSQLKTNKICRLKKHPLFSGEKYLHHHEIAECK